MNGCTGEENFNGLLREVMVNAMWGNADKERVVDERGIPQEPFKIRRESWAEGEYIFCGPCYSLTEELKEVLYLGGVNDGMGARPWQATPTDVIATDWEIM